MREVSREGGVLSGIGIAGSLGILFALFFIMLFAVSLIISFLPALGLSQRTEGLTVAALQSVLVFIFPTLIYARTISRKPQYVLDLVPSSTGFAYWGVCIAFILGLPFLNQIIFWNGMVVFPESLKGIESLFHEMEDRAMEATEILLSTTSIGGLISGVLIIGVLTGFAEELFFRGGVQNILIRNGLKPTLAIWITAFLFSFLHFQFFGFIPRFLLGAFFGYLLSWTGSIWVSVFAHSLNNSLVVVSSWLMRRGVLDLDLEAVGISRSGFPWVAVLSGILVILLLVIYRNLFFRKATT